MNRRQALSLLAALPFVSRLDAQTRPTAKHRLFLGGHYGLLLSPDGTLQSFSISGASGQRHEAADILGLGDARPISPYALYPVAMAKDVVTAAAGSAAFAVLKDGQILAWGATGSGDLGITPRDEFERRAQPRMRTNTPTPIAVKVDAVDISSKADHVIALARDGSVFTWGRGDSGQLGIGPLPQVAFKTRSARVEPYVPYPVRVPELEGVTAISAGRHHSLALLKDGTVRAWGANKQGQIGDGTSTNRDRPHIVPGVRSAVGIAAGGYASLALLADGTVMEWGAGFVDAKPKPVPVPVAGVRGIRSVAAGGAHAIAITHTGEVMTWGQDAHYQTGRGRAAANMPGLVKGLANVTWVAANDGTSIAVLGSGRIMTWGEVREWTRPDDGGAGLSPFPILLWLDGLDQS